MKRMMMLEFPPSSVEVNRIAECGYALARGGLPSDGDVTADNDRGKQINDSTNVENNDPMTLADGIAKGAFSGVI